MNQKIKGSIFVFLGACSFGVLSTIVKTAYAQGITLGQITGTQSFFGMSLLWLLYLVQVISSRNKKVKSTEKTTSVATTSWWKVCLAGTFTGLVGIFYYQCVKLLPASIAIILLMQYLWISIVIEVIFFKKRPHPIQLIAAGIVLIGTCFAGGLFSETLNLNVLGIIFGFLAAVAYALFMLTSGKVGNELPSLKKSALMITGSCVLTFLIFPPTFFLDTVLFLSLLKWGLALAFFGTVMPPLFFSIGVPKVGVSLGAILSAFELPVATLSSHFVLHEQVSGSRWFGVILIILAIILPNIKWGKRKKELAHT